ncbi:MAG: PAS domain-containing protein [Steroidobacteraceae bacterium]
MLGDRIHDLVLIHREAIKYTPIRSSRKLIGMLPGELVGQQLEDLVPPRYAELVGDNVRRRLSGAPAAERYEIDLIGLQSRPRGSRSATGPIEHEGRPALLVVGVEVLPTVITPAPLPPETERSPARLALESLSEAVLTTDAEGQVRRALNPRRCACWARRPSMPSARRSRTSRGWSTNRPAAADQPGAPGPDRRHAHNLGRRA